VHKYIIQTIKNCSKKNCLTPFKQTVTKEDYEECPTDRKRFNNMNSPYKIKTKTQKSSKSKRKKHIRISKELSETIKDKNYLISLPE
jgi:hypothetical protein